ncbi:MAG: hypothetical protein EBY22_02580 [Gammaproteobacteria bacterium]|jgi:hypothetical protein|nr:hypothetical protein [Gammaproteobacteria bacterium]
MSLTKDFCHCVKKVRKTIKLRRGQSQTRQAKESAAIAVCTKSVLQTRGLTMRKVRCGPSGPKKQRLFTQKKR